MIDTEEKMPGTTQQTDSRMVKFFRVIRPHLEEMVVRVLVKSPNPTIRQAISTLHRNICEIVVCQAFRELPIKLQDVLIMRDADGMSYEEMARILNISERTAKSRLHSAHRELGKKLAPFLQ